jgi:hypothetical protein
MAQHPCQGEDVRFEVTGAQPYGMLIRTDAGEHGWIEAEYLNDSSLSRRAWPPTGTRLHGLVLGITDAGRIRSAAAPLTDDPAQTTGHPMITERSAHPRNPPGQLPTVAKGWTCPASRPRQLRAFGRSPRHRTPITAWLAG